MTEKPKSKGAAKGSVEVRFTVPSLSDLEIRLLMLPLKYSLARQAMREEILRIKNWR